MKSKNKVVFYVVFDKELGFPLRFQSSADCDDYLRGHRWSFFLLKEEVCIVKRRGLIK